MAKKKPPGEIIPLHKDFQVLGRRVEALMIEKGLTKKAAAAKVAEAEGIKPEYAEKALGFALAFKTDADLRRLGAIRVPTSRARGPSARFPYGISAAWASRMLPPGKTC
jgi:hypothetical protein